MKGLALSILGVLAVSGPVTASTFSISPTRLELSAARSTAILTVRNEGDDPVVVQVRPVAWSQVAERDQLADTREILVTPPIFTLQPKGEQVLRVALLRKPDVSRELDYRVVLDEVLPEKPVDATALRLALRITLPVFVTSQPPATPDLTWHHTWLPDDSLHIEAHNQGTAHIQVKDFDVLSDGHVDHPLHASDAHYLLPGSTMHWQLPAPAATTRSARLAIRGHSDAGDFTVTSESGAQ
jgi:fimbrial chaperone protein